MKILVTMLVIAQVFMVGMVVGNNNQVSKASVGHVQPTQGGLTGLMAECEVWMLQSDCVQPADANGIYTFQPAYDPQWTIRETVANLEVK